MTLEMLANQGHSTIFASLAANIVNRTVDFRNASYKELFSDFRNTEHRLEFVANIHGIEFINDAMAESSNSTWFALENMARPVIWITGNDFDLDAIPLLRSLILQKVKAVIGLDGIKPDIKSALAELGKPSAEARNMRMAVELAYFIGKKGDIVLFSPACMAADTFRDFGERGKAFRYAVKNL